MNKKVPIAASTLAALGIVFGDIGTSPLYAFRECFSDQVKATTISISDLTGAASLILWALTLVISIKYVAIILRLDNKGEGGILALAALVRSTAGKSYEKHKRLILITGVIGASLIYADGILTPAISVLSAVEGLSVSAPAISHWILPIASGILLALFGIQKFGTEKVGRLFGPIVLIWFGSLAVLGIAGITRNPQVLLALNPVEGLSFLLREWRHAMPLLAAVFLAVTGGEALYADLGHFGIRPIRIGWLTVVMPALALNYLGQAALLSVDPSAIRNPFFLMAPEFLRFPLTILATCAAVVASQALISGAFSLTAQAVRLSIIPRVGIFHTSEEEFGQVYVPSVNWLFAVLCIILVLSFGSSSALAGAYGVAISLTMIITSFLFFYAATCVWKWKPAYAAILTSCFFLLDLLFLASNLTKIADGGWLPLLIATVISLLMLTWLWGRERLAAQIERHSLPIGLFVSELAKDRIHRVKGLAIYMSGHPTRTPPALLHNLKHNQVAHERIIILFIETVGTPRIISESERLSFQCLDHGVHKVTLRFGFSETPDIPTALLAYLPESLCFNPGKATYFLGRESYRVGGNAGTLSRLRLTVFAIMARNASSATGHFHIPPGRVVELGGQVTL